MAVEEVLYSAMEDYYIDIMIGAGETSGSVHLESPPRIFHVRRCNYSSRYVVKSIEGSLWD